MPHKHKRRSHDARTFDLPPSMIAKPLPVRDEKTKSKTRKAAGSSSKDQKKKSMTYANDALEDDTPKAFRRLMTMHTAVTTGGSRQRNGPSELEEREQLSKRKEGGAGVSSKKRKRDPTDTKNDASASKVATTTSRPKSQTAASQPSAEEQTKSAPIPKILPGEKLSDFAARVDRELPLSAMKKSSNPSAGPCGLSKIREERQTKHERRLLRLQRQWREDDARIREREEAEREEREAEMEEQLDLWKQWEAEAGRTTKRAAGQGGSSGPTQTAGSKNKKKKKSKGSGNNDQDPDDDGVDPWAKLKDRDRMNKPVNPFEVAQAPPQLTKPREIFKVRGGAKIDVANVPAAAGSLRRREELAGERRNIVEEYRRLMAEKRQ